MSGYFSKENGIIYSTLPFVGCEEVKDNKEIHENIEDITSDIFNEGDINELAKQ
ncbi:MAG: hypothetical protein WC516_09135 [Patescibacteria group bacterium]|jgi:hypothetical protein